MPGHRKENVSHPEQDHQQLHHKQGRYDEEEMPEKENKTVADALMPSADDDCSAESEEEVSHGKCGSVKKNDHFCEWIIHGINAFIIYDYFACDAILGSHKRFYHVILLNKRNYA